MYFVLTAHLNRITVDSDERTLDKLWAFLISTSAMATWVNKGGSNPSLFFYLTP